MLNNVKCGVYENTNYNDYFPDGIFKSNINGLKSSDKFIAVNYNFLLNSIDIIFKGGVAPASYSVEC